MGHSDGFEEVGEVDAVLPDELVAADFELALARRGVLEAVSQDDESRAAVLCKFRCGFVCCVLVFRRRHVLARTLSSNRVSIVVRDWSRA